MRFLIAGAAFCLLATSALAAEPAKRACFRAQNVDGFDLIDDQTVEVTTSPRDVYRLTLFAPSPDIDWTQQIAIEARGGSWICSGADATIVVPGVAGLRRYPVTQVRKLSPEEVRARRTR